ncbi:MAG: hypothetical protein RBS46_03180 [Methyloversatilis sp.]|jgi:hypothetical protein|nr:hypothetical protein [Methyloversatilis sp.]
MKPLSGAVCLVALAAALAGCGEKEQVVVYKQGQYQGKADGKPWDNESFSGDRGNWEATIKARNQNQNEYRRING